ncbi:MAG: molybdopterin molybdotransferase MoeA [Gallionella sp.]|nr:molybdopterin molybdotransferase MoeA [Gallionella sp.]MDP1942045.1 molybdopterin molybdotransferase MoeA [Gallionella sp.]
MEYLRVSEAQRVVLESVALLNAESVGLEHSLGRVLAEDIRANRDLPPYDVSAMDGYAVRSADLVQVPVTLEVIEDIKAGDMPSKIVQPGQCARIMTGAPLPQGADAVMRVEDTQEISTQLIQVVTTIKDGHDVRPQGENMRNGDVVLSAGTEITPGVIGILATVKITQMQVYRRPRVAILSTGNELEAINAPVDMNKIPDSNTYALMAQVQALGITPALLGIARDDPLELERYLRLGLEYDVLLVSGGTSVGVHDYVRPTIEKLGVSMKFWRVAMKPGHPLAFGVLHGAAAGEEAKQRDAFVFGLPGNPVSSMVCFEEFVAPSLRRMMGHARLFRRTVSARLAHPLKMRPGRTEFVRVQLTHDDAGYVASSTGTQSSGVLLSMARADGLLVMPSDSTGLAAGAQVTVQLLDGTAYQHETNIRE